MENNIFEKIKHINEFWNEYWLAREFAKVLGYKDFWNFENVVKKAKIACENSKQNIADHCGDITEMVKLWLNTQKKFPSWNLSRYACYLIIQNADPSKEIVALWQTYFAIQTRKQLI